MELYTQDFISFIMIVYLVYDTSLIIVYYILKPVCIYRLMISYIITFCFENDVLLKQFNQNTDSSYLKYLIEGRDPFTVPTKAKISQDKLTTIQDLNEGNFRMP